MSTLLEQASLVLIPSGYKEDVVYSAVPSDGSGDLAFSRASNGTRVNSAGLIEVCPWNLLQYSEDFANGYWNKYQASITSNTTTAPNGTATADTLSSGSGFSGVVYTSASFSAGDILTLSIYGKANTSNILQLGTTDGTDRAAVFNLSTGVVTYSVGVTASIESVGNGWYRCSVSRTMLNPANFFVVEATGSLSLFIWGAQTNVGSTAKPYFPTTDRLNVPRLTYQNGGGGCPSLLLEKQSTNSQTYSEQIDNAVWGLASLSVTANNTTSPDGTQNADKIVEDTANARHEFYGISLAFNGNNAVSFYAKNAGRRYFCALEPTGAGGATFDLQNGVVSAVTAVSASIENVGNGWYRCSVIISKTATTQIYYCLRTTGGVGIETYTGDGTSGVYFWGAQTELNSSYPTSYIPTTSASATRVADFDTSAGSSGNFGSLTPTGTKAVLYWELQFHSGSVTENINIGGFRNGTTNQYGMYYWGTNSNKNFGFNSWNGDSYGITGGNSLFDGQVHKIAGVFDFNNFANNVLFIDGVKKTISQTLGTTLQRSANVVSLNSPDYQFQGNKCLLKEFLYFNQNLSDAELASLTTL